MLKSLDIDVIQKNFPTILGAAGTAIAGRFVYAKTSEVEFLRTNKEVVSGLIILGGMLSRPYVGSGVSNGIIIIGTVDLLRNLLRRFGYDLL